MATITLEIPDTELQTALEQAAEGCGYALKDGFKVTDILDELTVDIKGQVTDNFSEYLVEAIEGNCFTNVLEEV